MTRNMAPARLMENRKREGPSLKFVATRMLHPFSHVTSFLDREQWRLGDFSGESVADSWEAWLAY